MVAVRTAFTARRLPATDSTSGMSPSRQMATQGCSPCCSASWASASRVDTSGYTGLASTPNFRLISPGVTLPLRTASTGTM